jgi:Flp pilus assembly protein TadG
MSRASPSETSRSERGLRRRLRRLAGDERGLSAVEFALLLPMLILLTLGVFETARLIMLNQKLQNSAFIMADLLARDRTITENDIANIFEAIETLIQPFDFENAGTVILTSVGATAPDAPFVNWQRVGAGGLAAASAVGATGEAAAIPATLSIRADETILVSEVFFTFEPFLGFVLEPATIRKVSYYKPRLGTLETVLP